MGVPQDEMGGVLKAKKGPSRDHLRYEIGEDIELLTKHRVTRKNLNKITLAGLNVTPEQIVNRIKKNFQKFLVLSNGDKDAEIISFKFSTREFLESLGERVGFKI